MRYFYHTMLSERFPHNPHLSAHIFLISLGFYVPALIYYNEKLAPWLKTLIHTLIGMPVFLLTAYLAGWMENSSGVLRFFLIAVGTAALWWLCAFLGLRAQAKKMNQKIKEKQKNE